MRRKPFPVRLAALALLLALVAGEALALVHSLDFDAHAGGDPCTICISVASLGAGVPPKAPSLDLPCTDAAVDGLREQPAPTARTEPPSARGPPLVS